MEYATFGALGWRVSKLSIGTVEFGLPYGFVCNGETAVPDRSEAKRLILEAFAAGVNFVDTSPTYGAAEGIIGEALREWSGSEIYIASKLPTWGQRVSGTVEETLRRLGRDHIDLLQIYSRSEDWEAVVRVLDEGRKCREEGKTRALGITIYDEAVGLRAVELDDLEALQMPYNVLDRRMAGQVIPTARTRGIAVWGRSALLKGILTERRRQAPAHLGELVRESDRLAEECQRRGVSLAATALRFCLSDPGIDSVLVGIRSARELAAALQATNGEDDIRWLRAETFRRDPVLLDPRTWKKAT